MRLQVGLVRKRTLVEMRSMSVGEEAETPRHDRLD